MATHSRKISKERLALKLSLLGTIWVASLGIGYGLYVGFQRHFVRRHVFVPQYGYDRS